MSSAEEALFNHFTKKSAPKRSCSLRIISGKALYIASWPTEPSKELCSYKLKVRKQLVIGSSKKHRVSLKVRGLIEKTKKKYYYVATENPFKPGELLVCPAKLIRMSVKPCKTLELNSIDIMKESAKLRQTKRISAAQSALQELIVKSEEEVEEPEKKSEKKLTVKDDFAELI